MAENLNQQSFKEKVFNFETNQQWKFEGDKPAVIDFYADWCAPCKMLAPVIEEMSKEYDGVVDFYKLDTEQEQQIAAMFNIRSIPTLVFCKPGEDPQIANGAFPKQQLEEIVEQVFGVKNPKA